VGVCRRTQRAGQCSRRLKDSCGADPCVSRRSHHDERLAEQPRRRRDVCGWPALTADVIKAVVAGRTWPTYLDGFPAYFRRPGIDSVLIRTPGFARSCCTSTTPARG